MAFRFVHTADIHLDSPLRSLSLRNPELAALIGDATRQALIHIVGLCLEERVDALIIAGDLYDGDQTSMKTARFLANQMERLHEANIKVFKIRGNHDALSRITQELVLPPSVKVFTGRAEAVEFKHHGQTVAVHGLSFTKPHAPESLLTKYKPAIPGAINIGLMHTSLAGAPGHDQYAPCSVADLHAAGFHYWGLGHIHQRSDHAGSRKVIMPGMPQGRDINEAGEKSVSLVTVHDDGNVTVEERLTSIAQFERISVDVSGTTNWIEVVERIGEALQNRRSITRSEHLVARLKLKGSTPLSWTIRRDLDLLRTEAEQRGERIGKTWIEKIELDLRATGVEQPSTGTDPILELNEIMRDQVMVSAGYREQVREMIQALLDDLPAEARQIAGKDDVEREAFLQALIAEGGEELVARMAQARSEDD